MKDQLAWALQSRIPYRLYETGGQAFCRWMYLGDKKFTEPFFDDTISGCRNLPENAHTIRSVSSLDILPEWSAQLETVAPAAFIFHVSRCGSTLVSQMLGMQPAHIVLSEVPLFDEILRWGFRKNNVDSVLPLLHAAIALHGVKRNESKNRLFIKTDSWHVHFYVALRKLYPGVPFILLYRKPDEVLRSQQKKRGMQAVPGVIEPGIFGFDEDKISTLSLDEYMAQVIESYLQAFVEILQTDKLAFAVNYNEGPLPIVIKIAALTGTRFSKTETDAMLERSGFHGKFPGEVFKEPMLQEPAPAYLSKAFELYDELEAIKTAV